MKFMNFRYLYLLLSACVIVPGLISLFLYGVRPSIDFTGGALLEVVIAPRTVEQSTAQQNVQPITQEIIQQTIGETYALSSVQSSGRNQVIVRGKPLTETQKNLVIEKLQTLGQVKELRFESVGPILGKELLHKTLTAAVIVCVFITLYIGHQFHSMKFGVCAVLAMLHDSLVMFGSFSLLGHVWGVEVDVLFVTAVLTVLSFSVHDTIVVFDRIREMQKKHRDLPLCTLIDAAVLETLGRSLNNSMTIIMMLASLVLLGGETIRWFSVALLIGAMTGTYSSTFTAAPLLVIWEDVRRTLKKKQRSV